MNETILAIAALGGFAVNFTALVLAVHRGGRKLEKIHVLVNSSLSESLDRIVQLVSALSDAGVDVPDDPARCTNGK